MKGAVGAQVVARLTRRDRLVHRSEIRLEARDHSLLDMMRRPFRCCALKLQADVATVRQALQVERWNADSPAGDEGERMGGSEALESLAVRHRADAERLGQGLYRHELA